MHTNEATIQAKLIYDLNLFKHAFEDTIENINQEQLIKKQEQLRTVQNHNLNTQSIKPLI